ncbi:hypothetical protein CEUSTIGMA_g6465.t1 [Chlamydomonas eustigma]|uniref:Uncharacterized protein n=1 Tax=Chlamydomonas eustigma TaxID=1157962 RepID=A0A250X7I9_9CHLO|nr:hypothetical protein CEUSTIGMA_g6465.t1 [Chlamydomonas eustigma]|eukprot:GAX79025.1 hypothetical protein CEUSTIGMA_g6465.t1 [Chlamydomonas eustigma]
MTYPSRVPLFRGASILRKVCQVSNDGKVKEKEVDQVGKIRILWMKKTYTSHLRMREDETEAEDSGVYNIKLHLLKSDLLSKFSGCWSLHPIRDSNSGEVVGCEGRLQQEVLPANIPQFVPKMPILGKLLLEVSAKALVRLMGEMNPLVNMIKAGEGLGLDAGQVLTAAA